MELFIGNMLVVKINYVIFILTIFLINIRFFIVLFYCYFHYVCVPLDKNSIYNLYDYYNYLINNYFKNLLFYLIDFY